MQDKFILALDFANKKEALDFVTPLKDDLRWVKVGMELFYKEGTSIVYDLKDMGFKIFLDLKLHDIPNTVEKATQSLLTLPIDMLNFHVAGGSTMLRSVAAIKPKDILFIGVTQLTSTSEDLMQHELGIQNSMRETVLNYSQIAVKAGLDGVVCSARDLVTIKEVLPNAICVCPGIRRAQDASDDQKRVMTPAEAIQAKADFIVVGRSLTKAKNPKQTLLEIYEEMQNG